MDIRPRSLVRLILALGLGLAWMATPLPAWDAPGHELVAAMAYGKLNPKAQAAVKELAGQLVNPEQKYDPITMACWMDDLRRNAAMPDSGLFLTWHYIDIPIDARDPMPSLVPGDDNAAHGNVVQALKRAIVVLKGGTDPYIKTKAEACALAMHLVGDIHQPLHCATKYFMTHGELHQDNGGNKEEVMNVDSGHPNFNLHAFWDSAWRASFDERSGEIVIDPSFDERGRHEGAHLDALATTLLNMAPAFQSPLDTDVDAWARESNRMARDFVYREVTATESKKACRLSSAYVAKAQAIARERLVLAAGRLATLLNETLGADQPVAVPPSYPAGPE